MRRIPALAVFVAASVLFAADPPSPAPAPTPAKAAAPVPAAKPAPVASGKVTSPDGKPVVGATVRAIPMPPKDGAPRARGGRADAGRPWVGRTDASGAFAIDGPLKAPVAVRVEAPGFAPALAQDVPARATLNVRLKPGFPVAGRVLDLVTHKPVAGATVSALEPDASRFGRDAARTAATADDGTFKIPDLASGVVVLEAIAPRKARARLDRVVVKAPVEGEEPKLDTNTLYLQPGGRIAGRVLGPDGKPLADALVAATASDGNLVAMMRDRRDTVWTDASGAFAFDGVAAGNKYTVRATKEGYSADDEGPIAVEAGTDRGDLELKLDTGATLAFRLLTADELPVKEVDVRLQPQGGGRRREMAFGGAGIDPDKIVPQGDGKFLVKALDAGTFDLVLAPPDYADVTKEGLKLRAGETVDLGTLRVKESKRIAGRVTDTSGQPVAGASVTGIWFDGMSPKSRETKTGADGRYRLAGLSDAPLRNLWVRAEGYAQGSREGAAAGDEAVDFVLSRTGSIVGRVLLAGGAAPAAFRVQAFPEAKEGEERAGFRMVVNLRAEEDKVFTDPTGRFRLDGVDPGVVTITALADGKAPGRKTGLEVAADGVLDIGTLVLEDGRTLRGRVVAAKDEAPIAGATVSVSQAQGMRMNFGGDGTERIAISGLDGRFEIAGLEPRAYTVDAVQPEYSPSSGRVEISVDRDVDDFVVTLSRGGTITGIVRDAQRQPVVNTQVILARPSASGGPQSASTGSDGRYTFEKLAPGDYIVMRAPSGGGPLMLMSGMNQVVVKEGETTVHDIDEAAKITLTGRVLRGGAPLPNAMILFTEGQDGGEATGMKQARSDAEGRYQIGLDRPGRYGVVVRSSGGFFGGGQTAISVEVPDQANPVVDITVQGAGITGRVTNPEGKPVSGAIVSVRGGPAEGEAAGHGGRGFQDVTEPDGTYRVEGLDPGAYSVAVAASGYRGAEVPSVTIASDGDVPVVDVQLEPGRTIRGRVVDANGAGISGAMVVAAASGSLPHGREALPASSDINGTFILTAPGDGAIDVTAVAAGFPPARLVGVSAGDDELLLKAPRSSRVRVIVLGGDGKPVAGARVGARPVPEFLGSNYLSFLNTIPPTGADGVTTAGPLGPGSYELVVTADSRRATRAVTIGEGAEGIETVVLP